MPRYSSLYDWLGPVVVFVIAAGCGLEAGPSSFDDQSIEESTENQSEPSSDQLGGGGGAGTMAGTWLKLHQASSCVLGQEQVTRALYLIDIEQDGAGLRETRRLCELELTPLLGFRPVASRAVLESVAFPPIDHGYMTNLLEGGTYASSTEVGLWGVELDDPIGESLPTDPDDERVIDADGDGNPGVSLALEGSGCSRFMGQRQIVRYFGRLIAPNEVRGDSAMITETEVYGASGSVCQLAPDIESNDDFSEFRMVRIDGQGGSFSPTSGEDPVQCDDVGHFLDEMLDPRQPDDDLCD